MDKITWTAALCREESLKIGSTVQGWRKEIVQRFLWPQSGDTKVYMEEWERLAHVIEYKREELVNGDSLSDSIHDRERRAAIYELVKRVTGAPTR